MFTVHACGFRPRLAVEAANPGTPRLQRIIDLIAECKFGIHDLSRVQIASDGDLPRFNMPFECGMFIGARFFGGMRHGKKEFLLLESQMHRHQRTLSDAAGLDPKVHNDDPAVLIACIRAFLAGHIHPRPLGPAHLRRLYETFNSEYPQLAARLGHSPVELSALDAFADWSWIAADWLAARAIG